MHKLHSWRKRKV